MASLRIPWSEQEAAVLVDYYMMCKNREITRKDAISESSIELRELAKQRGLTIDGVFRNNNGIEMQMIKIEDLFEGRSGRLKKAPKVFERIVNKYINDRPYFTAVLKAAREIPDEKLTVEEQFFAWLSGETCPLQKSELLSLYSEIELFCVNREILNKPLFDTTDTHTIALVKSVVNKDNDFQNIYGNKIKKMREAIDYYHNFIVMYDKATCTTTDITQDAHSTKSGDDNKNSHGNLEASDNKLYVSLETPQLYELTLPVCFSYFGEVCDVNSWTDLYVKVINKLYGDYPKTIKKFSHSGFGHSILICDLSDSKPNESEISMKLCNDNVETNLGITDILASIKWALDLCLVDYENVVITCCSINPEASDATPITLAVCDLTSYLTKHNVHYVDNRSKGGCLWLRGGHDLDNLVQYCKTIFGVVFKYKTDGANALEGKPGWWTKDKGHTIGSRASNDTALSQPSHHHSETKELQSIDDTLKEHFPKGYRIDSTIDYKRFVKYYNSIYGTELDVSDDKIKSQVKKRIVKAGVRHEDYIFSVDSLASKETKNHILLHIENCFSNGDKAVYFKALFEKFNEELLGQRIYDEDMLRTYLKHECGDKYVFERSFVAQEADVKINPEYEVKKAIISYCAPIKTKDLYARLSYLPSDYIDKALHDRKEFISNTSDEYFHISLIDFSDDELKEISGIIQQTIEEYNFTTGTELIRAIHSKYPNMLERFTLISQHGLLEAISYYLKDQFSFHGNVISSLQAELSRKDIFIEYAKKHDSFTIDELNVLKYEMSTNINFDSIYDNSLRISKRQFVSKEEANFDIVGVDKAISYFCKGDYIPLSGVTSFGAFPNAGFPWNTFLLEQYVSSYSKTFRLVHNGYNADNCVGAIVKNHSDIDDFNDLVIDVLANSNINLDRDDALQYLCDNGYLARKRFSDINQVIIKARAKKG